MSLDSFDTVRMVARRPTEADFPVFRGIHTDAGTMKTLSVDGSVLSEPESRAVLDRHLTHWEENGFGIWLFFDQLSGETIGYCGLRNYKLDGQAETELFYGVHSRVFQSGYGTEMARAVLDIGFNRLRLASIIAFTLADNVASRALMTKLGMQYEGEIEYSGLPHVLYRLNA